MGDPKHLILPLLTVIGAASIAYFQLGWLPAIVFTVAFGGGLILYMATAWRRRFDTSKIIIPYLLTVMFFVVHVYEEYVTDFEALISELVGHRVPEENFLFIAAFMAPFIWIGGAIMLIKQWAYGYYFLCAFFIAMTVAELAHFVFPFMVDGTFHYESGMYTAALPLIPAFYGLYVMSREIRKPVPTVRKAL